jgi:hypothetical protein
MFKRLGTVLALLSLAVSAVAAQSAPKKDIPTIAKAANGAIVTIVMANDDKPIARGTGFLVSADGVIVTNYHVIANGNVAIVRFPDDTVVAVDGVLAADKVRDLALIKIHGKSFKTLALGNSDRIQVGEDVVAIGNPLGLELTVSNGILSGVRPLDNEGRKFLQITAPISHGSSGGPLFNMAGEVIGITSAALEGGENLNFAIPVNDAKRLLNRSAELGNLPNEVEKETPPETHVEASSPVQEQTCKERAEKFVHYKRVQYGPDQPRVDYVSHFNAKSGVCFVENGFYFAEGKPYPSGRKYSPRILIEDAFSEGSGAKLYGSFSFGTGCTIQPLGVAREITCRSKEEFDDLASKYFGIPRPLSGSPTGVVNTAFAESSPDLEHGSFEQYVKDAAYCRNNPLISLEFPGREDLVMCWVLMTISQRGLDSARKNLILKPIAVRAL